MTERTTPWPTGTPAWADLSVSDVERSKTFYTAVLGWDYTGGEEEFGGYLNATLDGRTVVGMAPPMPGMDDAPPGFWTTYLAVEDTASAGEAITGAGGTALMPPMEVGPFGRMALYADPTGATFGTWEPGTHGGWQVREVPGAVAWSEAMTGDFVRGQQFYADAFGYTYEDISAEGMKYALFSVPGQSDDVMFGGIGEVDAGAGEQPYWSVVFAVDDVDAAVRRVLEAGGQVGTDPMDFTFGRIAVATGPDGEAFGLFTAGPSPAEG